MGDTNDASHPDLPLVSCVMIFLNGERFLVEAIDSVLEQSYDNVELILVDDGSTDRSKSIAQPYVADSSRTVRYLTHPDRENRGMSASRNLGVNAASGEFIAFLDADDVYLPGAIEEMVLHATEHPSVSLVTGRALVWHSWEGSGFSTESDRVIPDRDLFDVIMEPPEALVELLLREDRCPSTGCTLVKRSAYLEVGGFEDEFPGEDSDLVFYVKLFGRASVFVTDAVWFKYRKHPDSCTVRASTTDRMRGLGERSRSRKRYLEWVESYDSRQSHPHPEVTASIRRETWRYRHPWAYQARWVVGGIRRRLSSSARSGGSMVRSDG